MEVKTKYSRQREAILKLLKDRIDHPTADTLYEDVRKVIPNISLGTVYRNLAMLSKNGDILKISMADGSDRFDGNVMPHYHFTCNKCGAVSDIHMPQAEELNKNAACYADGVIENHFIMFNGCCNACMCKM